MKTEILNGYINKRLNSVIRHIKSYEKNENSKYLHQIRVNIKKIKAILLFAGYVFDKKYQINKIKKLFHKAGEIRELQINIRLLKTLPNKPIENITILEKRNKIIEKKFIENISKYINRLKNYHTKIQLPTKLLNQKDIKNYFKKQLEKASKEILSRDRLKMHQLRKRFKKIMYLYNALPEKYHKTFELNIDYIDELQNETGKWHDTFSTIKFLSGQRFTAVLIESINVLKVKENEQFNSLNKKINFKQFFNLELNETNNSGKQKKSEKDDNLI